MARRVTFASSAWRIRAFVQTVTVVRNVNLRSEQSSAYPPIRLLTPSEPPMDLLEPQAQDGYFHVKTTAGEDAYVLEQERAR